jgi:hypothetical protein
MCGQTSVRGEALTESMPVKTVGVPWNIASSSGLHQGGRISRADEGAVQRAACRQQANRA